MYRYSAHIFTHPWSSQPEQASIRINVVLVPVSMWDIEMQLPWLPCMIETATHTNQGSMRRL